MARAKRAMEDVLVGLVTWMDENDHDPRVLEDYGGPTVECANAKCLAGPYDWWSKHILDYLAATKEKRMSLDLYPTEEELQRVREWSYKDLEGLFDYIYHLWQYGDMWWKKRGNVYRISTGGWSGNEDLIGALQDNVMAWTLTWQSSRRGGHYIFVCPKIDNV